MICLIYWIERHVSCIIIYSEGVGLIKKMWLNVVSIDLLALLVFGYSLKSPTIFDLLWGLIIAIILALSELYPLHINDEGDLTLSISVHIASLLLLGLPATLIGAVFGEIIYGFISHQPRIKVCFNAAQTIISSASAYYFFLFIGGDFNRLGFFALFIPLTFIVVNTLLVAWILALSNNQPLWDTWISLNQNTVQYTTILGIGGLAFAGLLHSYSWLGVIIVIIMMICLRQVLFQASYNLRTMKIRFMQTVRVLMTALEYRDPYTHGHSSRVAVWCRKIANEMGLEPDEVEQIHLGGLMHDVGKVGVPDFILKKPGKLSEEEYEQIKAHTAIGENILLEMEGMEYIASMAKHHHLYYNGDPRGYNDSIPGKEASIGARILSVADAWDAMTTNRPYRKSLSAKKAASELVKNSGTQFDPQVVEVFINILKKDNIIEENFEQEMDEKKNKSEENIV